MLIIGLLLSGGSVAFGGEPILQLVAGLTALLLILGVAVLAVHRMRQESSLKE